jgi:hypothetical protein
MGIVILKYGKIVIGEVSLHCGGLKLKNFLARKGPDSQVRVDRRLEQARPSSDGRCRSTYLPNYPPEMCNFAPSPGRRRRKYSEWTGDLGVRAGDFDWSSDGGAEPAMLIDFSRRKSLGGARAFLSLAATHHGFVTPAQGLPSSHKALMRATPCVSCGSRLEPIIIKR